MSRPRAVLVPLVPALLLLASADCFSGPVSGYTCDVLRCLLAADGHTKRHSPPADCSFDQAVRRSSRRIHLQPGADGFATPATLAQSDFALPAQSVARINLPGVNLELAQCWQFLWRTALEPRAPSLVS